MTRIEPVPERSASAPVRMIYRFSRRKLGRDVDPLGVYAHAPRLLFGYGMLEQATAAQNRVPRRLKALAELKAAALVSCEFCCDIGSSLARQAGVSEAQLLALVRYRESEEFEPLEKLVLDYAVALSRTPVTVDEQLFASLREHFDERQLVELTNVIALENMRARFNQALEMTPAGFSEGRVCAVPERTLQAVA
jgi:AhpD family alkylhydroperoxidase